MTGVHYTYTLTGKGIAVVEHAPDARPQGDGKRTFTLYEERGEWVAECNFCGCLATSGKTRRSVASRMWGSRQHRYCYRELVNIEVDERLHYTYTRGKSGIDVEEHNPAERPAFDGRESYTVYKEGDEWASDCNRCGNWAGFSSTHEGVVARMFATHARRYCDEYIYENGSDEQALEATIEDLANMARRHGKPLAIPGRDGAS